MYWDSQGYIGTKHNTKTVTKSQLSFSVMAFWLTTFLIVSMYGIPKRMSHVTWPVTLSRQIKRQVVQNIAKCNSTLAAEAIAATSSVLQYSKCIKNTKGEALEITPASKNEFQMLPVSVEIYLGNE